MSDELDLAGLKAIAEKMRDCSLHPHTIDAYEAYKSAFLPPTVLALIEAAEQRDALQSRLAAAKKERDEANEGAEALDAKVRSLAPHGSCGCEYDRPGDLCAHHSPRLASALARIGDLETDNAKLRADLDKEIVGSCEGCGAPLFVDDDYVSDPDGVTGCWHSMSEREPKTPRPCYAYRVGKPDAAARVLAPQPPT